MANEQRGATAEDWYHFDFVLGLGGHLLPCVPASPDVVVVEGSALAGKVGKIPSQFNASGLAHGLREWQKREILSNEIKMWSADRRLNICVRTGPISGVYAFDVDVDDRAAAAEIYAEIEKYVGPEQPIRARPNSAKFLLPFYMDEPCKKRKIKLDDKPAGPAIELLADGQQFVAAGSHSSGARYQWLPGLPTHLPVLTLEQVNRVWTALTSRYATAASRATMTTYDSSAPAGPTANTQRSTLATGSESTSSGTSPLLTEISESDWSQLISALRHLTSHAGDNDVWSTIGYALLSLQGSRPAEQLWYDFSKKASGYTDGAPEAWWQAHRRQETRTDYRHIFTLARARGWGATSSADVFKPTSPRLETVPASANAQPGGKATDAGAASSNSSTAGSNGSHGANGAGGLDVIPPPQDKPIIKLVSKDFSQIIDQIETIARPEMYTQGSGLVTLSQGHEEDEIERDKGSIMLVPVSKAYARKRLGEMAHWMKFAPVKGEWYEVAPSAEHINAMIEQGTWRKLRPLDAIARAPFVRRDGSICDTAGYDRASRAILLPSAEFPPIPRNPDRGDALGALGRIRGIFHQFPWSTDAAESGFLAHVLSEAGRLAINKCPMFFYNAPSSGTGKTLLQKAASIISHGTVPALRPWVSEGDEVRKTVYASLLAGDRSLLFDNVPDGVKIRSAELCAALTAEVWQDRKLGESESRGVPNRAVFSASGNNVTPAGDLSRRSIIIRLDANTERLSQRRFDIEDLESYLVRERPSLLVDALTVIGAYHRTEATDMTMPVPLPSFEQWSHFVREPLIWLGLPDPVDTQRRAFDEDTQTLAALFGMLSERFGAAEFSGVDIARATGGITDQNGVLTNALLSCGCKEPNSAHAVGYWLRSNRDKVFGGMKLVAGAHSMVGMKWKFVKVE